MACPCSILLQPHHTTAAGQQERNTHSLPTPTPLMRAFSRGASPATSNITRAVWTEVEHKQRIAALATREAKAVPPSPDCKGERHGLQSFDERVDSDMRSLVYDLDRKEVRNLPMCAALVLRSGSGVGKTYATQTARYGSLRLQEERKKSGSGGGPSGGGATVTIQGLPVRPVLGLHRVQFKRTTQGRGK